MRILGLNKPYSIDEIMKLNIKNLDYSNDKDINEICQMLNREILFLLSNFTYY
jgi:hypothetical protein